MKKILSLLSLAALTIGLLGSCSKINERLDGLDKRINSLENDKIASVEQQISAINQSIADLETIRTNIRTLIDAKTAQGEDITKLKAADQALEGKINDLRDYINTELSKYSTKDWVNATFATLDQYEATCDTIARIDARLDSMDVRLSKSFEDCADSLKAWVNSQLDGYYTIAQMDAKVAEMNSALGAVSSESAAKADSLATELTTLKTAVDSAKANIRSEYKAAVQSAIETSEGKLSQALKDSIAEVNNKITALGTRVTTLEDKVLALEGKVDKLLAMIQSVTIVPAYNDGSVESTNDGVLYLDIIVSPAQAVATLTKDSLKVLVNEVKTRAVDVDTVAVTKFKADAAKGTITARADISSNLPVASSGKALIIAVNVKNGISDYTTESCPVYLSSELNVTVNDETDTTKVTIKADEDFPESSAGNIVVNDGFKNKPTSVSIPMPSLKVGGIGNVIFDETATAKIKANAEQAGATSVFFKVEDVTTTKPVENADVVLEVTMKAVDETGTEVFCYGKAEGEVTIQIPMDENVAYVNSVTLVDENDNPIQGGVVPGSEDFDKEKGILTFKVKHFSKYAVDYVTQAEYKAVTGVSIDPASVTLEVGDTLRLAATVTPENATNKEVSWSSSNTAVATVGNDGKVTAVSAGTATITVTTVDGSKTATCTVTVTPPAISTIADVLETVVGGFPKGGGYKIPSDDAWVSTTGQYAFEIFDAALNFLTSDKNYSKFVTLDTKVTQGENCYTATTTNSTTLTFNMTNGKLTSIIFSSTEDVTSDRYNGTYAPSPVLPEGALSGVFSVSATKKVCFSKGNLIATIDASGTPTAWKFAANQYDYLEQGGANKTIGTAAGDVDLFGWSTSNNGGTSTTDNYGIKTSTSSDDYLGEFYDWGKAVDNKNTWRTLTIAEWQYLINVKGDENIRKDKYKYGVTVCGKANCLVLAPDDFAGTIESSYDTAAWASAEAAGLVCLPAAGHRYGSSTIYTADHGRYWSSSVRDVKFPYYVEFYDNRVSHDSSSWGYYGCSVRLVTDVPAK